MPNKPALQKEPGVFPIVSVMEGALLVFFSFKTKIWSLFKKLQTWDVCYNSNIKILQFDTIGTYGFYTAIRTESNHSVITFLGYRNQELAKTHLGCEFPGCLHRGLNAFHSWFISSTHSSCLFCSGTKSPRMVFKVSCPLIKYLEKKISPSRYSFQ